jgi:Glutamate mutase epsilon subunit
MFTKAFPKSTKVHSGLRQPKMGDMLRAIIERLEHFDERGACDVLDKHFFTNGWDEILAELRPNERDKLKADVRGLVIGIWTYSLSTDFVQTLVNRQLGREDRDEENIISDNG